MLNTAVFNLILTPRLATPILFATLCFGADSETTKDIFAAIRANDLATLKTLAVTGANERGDRDTTPLMFASAYGSVDAVELLERGRGCKREERFRLYSAHVERHRTRKGRAIDCTRG